MDNHRLAAKPFPFVLAAILAVTAIPIGFRYPSLDRLYTQWNWDDNITNVLLYIPFGLFSSRSLIGTLCLALGISTAVELDQFVAPSRYPGPLDVISNTLGACLGSCIALVLRRMDWDLAVIRIPRWLGWVALIGGGASLLALCPQRLSENLSHWSYPHPFLAATFAGRYARLFVDERLSLEADLGAGGILLSLLNLSLAYAGGALLSSALILLGSSHLRRPVVYALVAVCGAALIFSMPSRTDTTLSGSLVAALLLGIGAADRGFRAVTSA